MSLSVLTPREASIFGCLCDTVIAPEPPLPAVPDTDAVEAFDRYLFRSPRLNRTGLRVLLHLAGRRLRRLDRDGRAEALGAAEASRWRQLVEPVEAAVRLSYFGDDRVMRTLGYDAEANMRRARAAR